MSARYLGLSGKIRAGKDTMFQWLFAADAQRPGLFKPYAVKRYGFADLLREIAIHSFGVPHDIAYGDDAAKATQLPYGIVSVRECMQKVGAAMRECEPDVFIRRAFYNMECLASYGNYLFVITDVRFPNEVEAIKAHGGKVVRLLRNPRDLKHPSEVALDEYKSFDCVLDNTNQTEVQTFSALLQQLKLWGWADA